MNININYSHISTVTKEFITTISPLNKRILAVAALALAAIASLVYLIWFLNKPLFPNGKYGALSFDELLPKMKSQGAQLKELCLSFDSNHPITLEQLKEVIRYCPNLTKLTVNGAKLDEEALKEIGKLTHLTTLHMDNFPNLKDAHLEHLAKLPLEDLHIARCDELTDAGFEQISKLSKLKYLFLNTCSKITGLGCGIKIPSLQNLHFSDCPITDHGLEKISQQTSIQYLSIHHCNLITDVGVAHIAKLPLLKNLVLNEATQITDVGVAEICKITMLSFLCLNNCTNITDVSLKQLSKMPKLFSLSLDNCKKISDDGLEDLAKINTLEILFLRNCKKITNRGIEALGKLPHLRILDVSAEPSKITERGFLSPSSFPALSLVRLDNVPLSSESLHRIEQKFSKRQDLGLKIVSKLYGFFSDISKKFS